MQYSNYNGLYRCKGAFRFIGIINRRDLFIWLGDGCYCLEVHEFLQCFLFVLYIQLVPCMLPFVFKEVGKAFISHTIPETAAIVGGVVLWSCDGQSTCYGLAKV